MGGVLIFVIRLRGNNADRLAVLRGILELDLAVHKGEQGVIGAASHVCTRVDMGAALANDDVTGGNVLTVCALYAKAFAFAVASVLGRADALFMSKKL